MKAKERDALKQKILEIRQHLASLKGPLPEDIAEEIARFFFDASRELAQPLEEEGTGQPPISPQGGQPDDQLKKLWYLAKGDPQAFSSYLSNVPNPEINAILRSPQRLQQLVTRLQQLYPDAVGQPQVLLENAPLQSSNIHGFQYDPKTQRLWVKFQEGGVYGYSGVPAYIFNLFKMGAHPCKTGGRNKFGNWWIGKQPSLGSAFYNFIRQGGYPYRRLA